MSKLLDVLERSAWTFVQSFAAAAVLASGLALVTQIRIATGAAVIAVLKALSIDQTVRGQLAVLDGLTPKDDAAA